MQIAGMPFMFGGEREPETPKAEPMWEATDALLGEVAAAYRAGLPSLPGHPYKRGDRVMLRSGLGPPHMVGRPGVVVEVIPIPELFLPPEGTGTRIDTRVAIFDSDHDLSSIWTESWAVVPFIPPVPESRPE